MADEELTTEQFLERCRQAVASVEDENGIDVTQIDHVLSLTPTQRLEELEAFLDEIDALTAGRDRPDAEVEGAS